MVSKLLKTVILKKKKKDMIIKLQLAAKSPGGQS